MATPYYSLHEDHQRSLTPTSIVLGGVNILYLPLEIYLSISDSPLCTLDSFCGIPTGLGAIFI